MQALLNAFFLLGYLLLVACYTPQWWRILRTGQTAGISPWLLLMVTAGLALIQLAVWGGGWGELMRWGNGAALVNALITDAAYLRAKRREKRCITLSTKKEGAN